MEKRKRDICRQAPGVVSPVVDPARCEGKAACVEVGPVDVFEIVRIPAHTSMAYRASPSSKSGRMA